MKVYPTTAVTTYCAQNRLHHSRPRLHHSRVSKFDGIEQLDGSSGRSIGQMHYQQTECELHFETEL
ncbi:hypothetical protein Mapa_015262 [Marchantia paleacea]|nr:hypothetical protein Mapa_015262 [Marchantia paleacea]